MKIREVIATLNRMCADGVAQRYAIGGAVGATFYVEPAATADIDIFLTLTPEAGKLIATMEPIYQYLKAHGATVKDEHLVIADWPVQFLPAETPLLAEALAQAQVTDVEGEPTRVFSAEHLAAIALETGRAKDKLRLLQFIEAGVLDMKRYDALLARHDLVDKWRRFERQYPQETP